MRMSYQITVLTLADKITSATNMGNWRWAPWTDRQPIVFNDPVLTTIHLSDDDPDFNSSYYTPDEDDQKLLEPATFGYGDAAVTYPVGTGLANFQGSIIEGQDGNQFFAVFPRLLVQGDFGDEIGDRHSVLIFPLARSIDGQTVFPDFTLDQTYTYISFRNIGILSDSMPYAVPCFAEGTLIRTDRGPRPIQTLRPGDRVATLDHGPQPILWLGHRRIDAAHLDLRPQDRPIRIAAGALGPGRPGRDMLVSPQHRMLLRSAIAGRMLGSEETLVAARHLIGQPGIGLRRGDRPVTYWHLLTGRHEVIEAEGAWSESLYPGPMALNAFSPGQVAQIHAALPHLRTEGAGPFARPVPTGRQARQLLQRHLRNAKPLVRA
ncbi:Hint domain-containing protein [Paracoccus liaowanqingii]|uniref:Hint domain-containing protein n=2 Tax=Paracoccus liaowanqingii TaxID=2560053 RepID=A0A4P7HKQ6_9RHOB|nr:Hint domain-containing protein [Paracoccus liaowanqingii]